MGIVLCWVGEEGELISILGSFLFIRVDKVYTWNWSIRVEGGV